MENKENKEKEGMFYCTFQKKDGKLTPLAGKAKLYQMFVESLEEGQKVEIYFEADIDNGTNAQLAKINAMIREIASETGDSFEDVKLRTKKQTGFCTEIIVEGESHVFCKSFANCSKKELSSVIQYLVTTGQFLNINFPK